MSDVISIAAQQIRIVSVRMILNNGEVGSLVGERGLQKGWVGSKVPRSSMDFAWG